MQRSRRRQLGAGVLVALVALGIGIWLSRQSSGTAARMGFSTATEAWVLPALNGHGTVALQQFYGKPVVAVFFASWCTACKGELPGLFATSEQISSQVDFVGVDSQESGDGLSFAKAEGITNWPLALDVDGVGGSGLHDAAGGQGMPITLIYSAKGKLQKLLIGATGGPALRAQLQILGDL